MKLNESETSLAAYSKNVSSFANRSLQVLEVLKEHGPLTSNEIFEFVKHTFPDKYRHNTHARLSDLRDSGLVFEAGKRECLITEETVTTWTVTPEDQVQTYRLAALARKTEAARRLLQRLEAEMAELLSGQTSQETQS